MSSIPTTTTTNNNSSTKVIGCVKWFNHRYGYGFLVTMGEHAGYGEVFVHHSQLCISDPNIYKFLMTGEYVQFEIGKSSDGKHEYQANQVTGVLGGKLMCEHPTSAATQPQRRSTGRRLVEEEDTTQPGHPLPHRDQSLSSSSKTANSRASASAPPKPDADGFVVPKSKKPRQPKSVPAPPTPRPSAPLGPEHTRYKNALTKNSAPRPKEK